MMNSLDFKLPFYYAARRQSKDLTCYTLPLNIFFILLPIRLSWPIGTPSKYISGWVLGLARKLDSDISPTLP